MSQIETSTNLTGFGSGSLPGEHYFSVNMLPGQFGLDTNITLAHVSVDGSPGRFAWLSEYANKAYAQDTTGKLFVDDNGWNITRTPTVAGSGNGLLTDQKGRLLYATDRYLGMYDGTWTDTWKDFTAALSDYRPMDTYEDWVVIGNDNNIAALNTTDDSLNLTAFSLPSGFRVRAIKTNRGGILTGANVANRGVIFLWKVGIDRSISEWIWFKHRIQSICRAGDAWIVTTTKEQYLTDGYTLLKRLAKLPDSVPHKQTFSVVPDGTFYLEDKLYTATSNLAGNYTRCRAGVYILDMATDLYSLVLPPADWMNATMGAIYQTSTPKTFVSYSSSAPVAHYLCELKNDLPTHALLISEPFGQGATKKTAEYVLLALQPLATKQSLYQVFSVDIAVKLANVKRQLWAYALTNAVSAAKNQLAINGTGNGFGNAMVGDEVTILTGSNTGHVRHIKTISNQNTATEVWTFDAELPNLTENGTHLSVQPFQLIKKKTISNADITVLKELEDILYPVTNKIAGRRFLLKVVLSSMSDQPLTIPALSLIYNDNGTI